VKICGLMRAQDVAMCARHGVDIAGFVVAYPRPVPWNLSLAEAVELMAGCTSAMRSCVVTSGSVDHVLAIAARTRPDYIQLHGAEPVADTARLVEELRPRGVRIIKALFPDMADLENAALAYCEAGIFALLFDPRTPEKAHQGGAADLAVYDRLGAAVRCPVVLAGGITARNAAEIVRRSKAPMIDLMTGVESRPGIKEESQVIALLEALSGLSPPGWRR